MDKTQTLFSSDGLKVIVKGIKDGETKFLCLKEEVNTMIDFFTSDFFDDICICDYKFIINLEPDLRYVTFSIIFRGGSKE